MACNRMSAITVRSSEIYKNESIIRVNIFVHQLLAIRSVVHSMNYCRIHAQFSIHVFIKHSIEIIL